MTAAVAKPSWLYEPGAAPPEVEDEAAADVAELAEPVVLEPELVGDKEAEPELDEEEEEPLLAPARTYWPPTTLLLVLVEPAFPAAEL